MTNEPASTKLEAKRAAAFHSAMAPVAGEMTPEKLV
jgi:hypothetical protein